jgi:hypothetical protein
MKRCGWHRAQLQNMLKYYKSISLAGIRKVMKLADKDVAKTVYFHNHGAFGYRTSDIIEILIFYSNSE